MYVHSVPESAWVAESQQSILRLLVDTYHAYIFLRNMQW